MKKEEIKSEEKTNLRKIENEAQLGNVMNEDNELLRTAVRLRQWKRLRFRKRLRFWLRLWLRLWLWLRLRLWFGLG